MPSHSTTGKKTVQSWRKILRDHFQNYGDEESDPRIVERKRKNREYQQRYYQKNRKKTLEKREAYRNRNTEKTRAYCDAWRLELVECWGDGCRKHTEQNERGLRAEYIMAEILKGEDYDSVLHTASLYNSFPIADILARRGDEIHAFQVTTYPRRRIQDREKRLLLWLGWSFHVIFVRPSFVDYWKVPFDVKKRVTVNVPVAVVTGGGIPIPELLRKKYGPPQKSKEGTKK